MKVDSTKLKKYRNINEAEIYFAPGVNIFCGSNGQGKTNLLEALWLFTGAKSFRGARNSELIMLDEDKAELEMKFFAENREQCAKMTITGDERTVTLNDVKLGAPSELIGRLCAVVFSPEHLTLINGSAHERRAFLDNAVCQFRPSFTKTLVRYNKVLQQRNALLKQIKLGQTGTWSLEPWNMLMCSLGAEISAVRQEFSEKLTNEAVRLYCGISGGREEMSIKYQCSYAKGESEKDVLEKALNDKLEQSAESDVSLGYTYYGPHRDDMDVRLDSLSARQFGSQGQKRSCVLALKLAQAALTEKMTGEMPVAILDDVLSELDEERQRFLLSKMDGWQVMITCCDEASVKRMTGGKVFFVSGGAVSEKAV